MGRFPFYSDGMKYISILLVIVIAATIGFFVFDGKPSQPGTTVSPSVSPTATVTQDPNAAIQVSEPRPGATVSGRHIVVSGKARTFEQTVNWRLRSAAGAELSTGFTTADGVEIGTFGNFSFTIDISDSAPTALVIEVFEISAKSGEEIHKVIIPVTRQ